MTTIQILICINCYMIAKMVVWWLLFGTGRLLFGKLSFAKWLHTTIKGSILISVMAGIDLLFAYYPPEPNEVLDMMLLPFLLASFWIAIRETTSICGLLAGDWNPFHPKLRFFSFMFIVNHFRNLPKEEEHSMFYHLTNSASPYYWIGRDD